jgi:hypothetical protein
MPEFAPQPTPAWVTVDTGNAAVDAAFAISVKLVDELRAEYHAAGGLPGWLPVSGGIRGPLVDMSDRRDSAHAVKMAAFLWGEEPGIEAVMERAMMLDVVDAQTGRLTHPSGDVLPAVQIGMQCRCMADLYRYFAPGPKFDEALQLAARAADWVAQEYDPEGSGMLDVKNAEGQTFWGCHLGEPNHYPTNYDPKSKALCPTMAFAVWLRHTEEVARQAGSPTAAGLARHLAAVRATLEGPGWSERYGYYYMQFDRLADKWFFSLNGLRETSREVDVTTYYAAEGGVATDRQHSVARWIDHMLMEDRVFPSPILYPVYAWYSPEHPNYIDHGRQLSVIGGAWDTPYQHNVSLLREAGLVDTLELAVRKRAEAIQRDGDCLEWFYLDGTVDNATGFIRDRYLVCATAQIATTIEGLFGVTPAAPHFAEFNIAPSLPLFRRHRHTVPPAPYAERDNRLSVTLPGNRRLDLVIRYSEADEVLRVRTNAMGVPAHFRLPVDLPARVREVRWAGEPVPYTLDRLMDQDFVRVDHVLDGGELTVHMDPHPQRGKGTTPMVADLLGYDPNPGA